MVYKDQITVSKVVRLQLFVSYKVSCFLLKWK